MTTRRDFEVCILAGGLSTRMGRDKARLRLGGRTLIGRIKSTVADLQVPIRVIRRDLVPRCGPIGGVLTALRTAHRDLVLFLSCDMPFVPASFIRRVAVLDRGRATFTQHDGRVGFPFAVHVSAIAEVERLIAAGRFSLQFLARSLKARTVNAGGLDELFLNVNTPAEWDEARRIWRLSKPSGKR